jgi:hypothetical protein
VNKPPWDFSEQGKVLMHEWLNTIIGDTPYGVAAFLEANNAVEVLRAFFGQIEPPKRLIERLAAGDASADDQSRAAAMLNDMLFPKPSGPKPTPKHQRNPILFIASHEARLINELWREYYGHVDLDKAAEFACERCRPANEGESKAAYKAALHDLGTKVIRTLSRKKDRNFSKP